MIFATSGNYHHTRMKPSIFAARASRTVDRGRPVPGYHAPMGFLRNATGLLCCLIVVMVVIGVVGVSRSRRRNRPPS
jgi:hypothetical protein